MNAIKSGVQKPGSQVARHHTVTQASTPVTAKTCIRNRRPCSSLMSIFVSHTSRPSVNVFCVISASLAPSRLNLPQQQPGFKEFSMHTLRPMMSWTSPPSSDVA